VAATEEAEEGGDIMRITERQLRQIIREEVGRAVDEDANPSDDEGTLVDADEIQTEAARGRRARSLREAQGRGRRGPGTPGWIGGMSASIGGDTDYTDRMDIWLNDDGTVSIEVSESGPGGGMDMRMGVQTMQSPGITVPGDAKSVLAGIKSVIDNNKYNFKRYGVPTKNFKWADRQIRGLSLRAVSDALDHVAVDREYERMKNFR
jgi:hypothetical protein